MVDSGIVLSMVNVLESTKGDVIVNSGIGSHTPRFSLDLASEVNTDVYASFLAHAFSIISTRM
jgi:hypothetical protein